MVYRFTLISDEVDQFLREIQINDDATFLDLHKAILASVGYPDDQMTSFFLCDEEWERQQQVTREDMGEGMYDEEAYVMADTPLCDLIEGEGQKLEFVFDPFGERSFYLKVREEILGETLDEGGEAPCQYEEINTDDLVKTLNAAKTQAAQEDDEEAYDPYGIGGDTYNDDEFDAEAYEISDEPLY